MNAICKAFFTWQSVIFLVALILLSAWSFGQVIHSPGRVQPIPLHSDAKGQPDMYIGVVYQSRLNQRVAENDFFYIFLIFHEDFKGEIQGGNQLIIALANGESVFMNCDDYTPPPIAVPSTGGFFRLEPTDLEKLIASQLAVITIETSEGVVEHPVQLNNNVFVDYFRR